MTTADTINAHRVDLHTLREYGSMPIYSALFYGLTDHIGDGHPPFPCGPF